MSVTTRYLRQLLADALKGSYRSCWRINDKVALAKLERQHAMLECALTHVSKEGLYALAESSDRNRIPLPPYEEEVLNPSSAREKDVLISALIQEANACGLTLTMAKTDLESEDQRFRITDHYWGDGQGIEGPLITCARVIHNRQRFSDGTKRDICAICKSRVQVIATYGRYICANCEFPLWMDSLRKELK